VLAAACLAFFPVIQAQFHLDDYTLFADVNVTSVSGWRHFWRLLQFRPLTYFTFWLNYQLSGSSPASYHVVNLALHLSAVRILYGILSGLIGQRTAIISAAVFALHPIQTEPISYIFERATLLATLFSLLCTRSWLNARYWQAAGCFVLALLSKEECVTLPVFLILLRQEIRPAIGLLGLSLAAGLQVFMQLKFLNVRGAGATAGVTPFDYLSTQGYVILRYFRLVIMPFGFSCDPEIPILHGWHAWLPWCAIVLVAAILIWRLHPYGKWLVGGLVLLLPSSSIFPAEDLAADRRLYLPMVALAPFIGLLLQRISREVIIVSLMLVLAAVSFRRAEVWSNERALWTEASERAPRKIRPRILLARMSDIPEAMTILDATARIAPNDPRPEIEKGLRLMQAGRADLALGQFERALAIKPNDLMALNDHATALAQLGQREPAIEEFRRVLAFDPCWTNARTNLARLGGPAPPNCK
jgi:hypothetical protein